MAKGRPGRTELCSVMEGRLLVSPDERSTWWWTGAWAARHWIIGILLQSCDFPLVGLSDSCNKKTHHLASQGLAVILETILPGAPHLHPCTNHPPLSRVGVGQDWWGEGLAMRRKHIGRIKWRESYIMSCKHIWEGAPFNRCHMEVSHTSWCARRNGKETCQGLFRCDQIMCQFFSLHTSTMSMVFWLFFKKRLYRD